MSSKVTPLYIFVTAVGYQSDILAFFDYLQHACLSKNWNLKEAIFTQCLFYDTSASGDPAECHDGVV